MTLQNQALLHASKALRLRRCCTPPTHNDKHERTVHTWAHFQIVGVRQGDVWAPTRWHSDRAIDYVLSTATDVQDELSFFPEMYSVA